MSRTREEEIGKMIRDVDFAIGGGGGLRSLLCSHSILRLNSNAWNLEQVFSYGTVSSNSMRIISRALTL